MADVVRNVSVPLDAVIPTPPHGRSSMAGSSDLRGNAQVDVMPALVTVTTSWRTRPLIVPVERTRSLITPRSTSPRSTTTCRAEVCQPSAEIVSEYVPRGTPRSSNSPTGSSVRVVEVNVWVVLASVSCRAPRPVPPDCTVPRTVPAPATTLASSECAVPPPSRKTIRLAEANESLVIWTMYVAGVETPSSCHAPEPSAVTVEYCSAPVADSAVLDVDAALVPAATVVEVALPLLAAALSGCSRLDIAEPATFLAAGATSDTSAEGPTSDTSAGEATSDAAAEAGAPVPAEAIGPLAVTVIVAPPSAPPL